jgi:hypothetical protein
MDELMDFGTALNLLRDLPGAEITKLEWGDPQYRGALRDGRLQLHKPDGRWYDWLVSEGDLAGRDWRLLPPQVS